MTDDQCVSLSFEVKNTGKVAADEIAQIYLSPTEEGQKIRPLQLQGFARVSLQPGETKTVKAKIYTEQFGFYSNEGQRQWNILPGTFIVKVGASSADIRLQEKVTLAGDPVTMPLREFYFSDTTIE
jgi:beta-glucosidase